MQMRLWEVSAPPEASGQWSATEHVVGKDGYGARLDVYTGKVVNAATLEELRALLAAPPIRATYRVPDKFKKPDHIVEVWTL